MQNWWFYVCFLLRLFWNAWKKKLIFFIMFLLKKSPPNKTVKKVEENFFFHKNLFKLISQFFRNTAGTLNFFFLILMFFPCFLPILLLRFCSLLCNSYLVFLPRLVFLNQVFTFLQWKNKRNSMILFRIFEKKKYIFRIIKSFNATAEN